MSDLTRDKVADRERYGKDVDEAVSRTMADPARTSPMIRPKGGLAYYPLANRYLEKESKVKNQKKPLVVSGKKLTTRK